MERRQAPAGSRIEYVSYESPVLLDAEALARAPARAGTCGVCITGGSGAAEELAEAELEQGSGSAAQPGSSA